MPILETEEPPLARKPWAFNVVSEGGTVLPHTPAADEMPPALEQIHSCRAVVSSPEWLARIVRQCHRSLVWMTVTTRRLAACSASFFGSRWTRPAGPLPMTLMRFASTSWAAMLFAASVMGMPCG